MSGAYPTKPGLRDWHLLLRLLPFARPDRRLYLVAILVTPVAAALSLAQPALVRRALDDHVIGGELEGLGTVLGLYMAAVLGWMLLDLGSTLALAHGGQRTILRLRAQLFRHATDLPQSYHDGAATGGLLTRLTSDVEALGETLTSRVVTIGMDLLVMIGALVAMLLIDAQLTLLLLLLAPPLLGVVELCRRQLRKLYIEVRAALSASNAYMAERIDGLEVIQLFGAEPASLAQFAERNERYRHATVTANVWDASMYATVDGASAICTAGLLWYASSKLGYDVSIGVLVAFLQYLQRLFQPLREISSKISVIQRAIAAMDRIAELLDIQPRPREGVHPTTAPQGHIQIEGLRFAYGRDQPDILRGIDLELKTGEVVALVGPTGCGKTTLTRLVTGAYGDYRGSIRIDGTELSSLSRQALHAAVVPVLQDVQLFPESVSFNIALGRPLAAKGGEGAEGVQSKEETARNGSVEAAAKLAQAHELIRALEGGYEHRLGAHGQGISVGQGQLLGFARALVRDTPVVILDEATASIDSVTEGLVQVAVSRLLDQRTVLVVAHRLSTVTQADRIAVMEDGQIVEIGSHTELLKKQGAYAGLWASGFGDSGDQETGSTRQG